MDGRKRVLRLIIEDHEDVIYWDEDVTQPLIHDLVVYVVDELRKKFSTDSFTYRNFEGTTYQLENIAQNLISPIFLLIPNRKNFQTEIKVDPRNFKNVYIFKNADVVRIQRFEKIKRIEEVELKIVDIRVLNEANKNKKFASSEPSPDVPKTKLEARSAKGPEEKASPISPRPETNTKTVEKPNYNGNSSSTLRPGQGYVDMSKRDKSPLPNDRSQSGYNKPTETSKNSTGAKSGPQNYTIQEVAQHSTRDDAWMVINGKVYDVTRYIVFHPGGQKIMAGVGKDGTALFNKYHSWVNADALLAKYHIGFLKR